MMISLDRFSLLSESLNVILNHLDLFEDAIEKLPPSLRDKAAFLMGKRRLITDSNIHRILHPGTLEIDLSQCYITDHSLFKLNLCPLLTYINLECLNTSSTTTAPLSNHTFYHNHKEPNYKISPKSLVIMGETCRNLQDVILTRCDSVTDAVISSLAKNCKQLHKINIGGCKLISDKALAHLGYYASNLSCIDFSYTLVTNKGVLNLARGKCKRTLREVSMNGCVNLTDEAVEALVPFTNALCILCFQDCPLMTNRSTIALARMTSNRTLQYVTFTIY